ncbi:tryptophan halogenase family protein [Pseudomarimonas arenosa]|uniref:Tryptophan 7-halogenase n=1 Tax=Pseudomarimonas arenosa TaxID=2774145 RepID=A0AAW3ZMP5_9GAMM|nr:tryptophan halogenase family protein [Pseudomarimonas arenosa]MBD8526804.1 tryptophan 7-halogenase [Pseudomarimonas arenosa]
MNHTTDTSTEVKPVRRVVIAGGGTAGWMAAAAISKTLGKRLEITLVESEEIGTVGVGEATIPTLVTFHRLIDLNEQAFMAATQATIKLGIQFENWKDVGQHYIHSFGTTGKDHWSAGFQHFWLKGWARGLARDYGDYCLELRAAEESRFAHLPRTGLNYAFHLDAGLYARFLRQFSEHYGTRRVEGKIRQVHTDPANGFISALELENGECIEGDLFIDCTGFRSLLLGQTLGVEFEDWSHWLFSDSAFAVQTGSVKPAIPYTRSIAGESGWQWRIPLQHRVGNGHVFASRFIDAEQAKQQLLSTLEGEVLTEPRLLRFTPGQRRKVWAKNCIALGLASGFLEPLESTNIHLIQRGITRLMQSFPAVINQVDIDEYNAQTEWEITHIRDFIILHYHVTNRRDTPFWRACAEMSIPDSLQHRIDLFRETARVFRVPNELFAENSWIQVMLGQGIEPRSYHPVADLMGDQELNGFLEGIRGGVERMLRQLPQHHAYLQSYCPAKAM